MGNVLDFVVGIKNAAFKRGLHEMKDEAGKVRSKIQRDFSKATFGSISSAIAGAFTIGAVKGFLEHMDKIADTATRFGASAVDIQKVGKAAELSDVSIAVVAKNTLKLAAAAEKAAEGGKKQQEQFAALNVDAERFAKSDLQERVLMLAEGYEKASKDGEGLNDFISALGMKAGALIPILANGKKGLEELFASTPAMGDGMVQTLGALNDRLDEMKGRAAGVGIEFMKVVEKAGAFAGFLANFNANLGDGPGGAFALAKRTLDDQLKEINQKYDGKEKPGGGRGDGEEDPDEVEEKKRILALREQIEEATRKAKLEEMDLDARINELYRQRGELLADVDEKTEDGLKAKLMALAIDEEAHRLEEQRGAAIEAHAKKVAGLQAKQEEELAAARAKEQEQDEKNAYQALPDNAARRTFLQGKQSRLMKEAAELEEKAGFENKYDDDGAKRIAQLQLEASQKRLKAKEIAGEVMTLKDDELPEPRKRDGRIYASNFAETGLGGNAAANGIGDKQLAVQTQMRDYLARLAAAAGAPAPKPKGRAFSDERHGRRR